MQSTRSAYESVQTLGEYELEEVYVGQDDSSPLSTKKPPNEPVAVPLSKPQKLRRFQIVFFIVQILLMIFPVLFISLAATAVSLDKKSISSTGKTAEWAISLSPTVFPIVFAAIIGKFFRVIGVYGAERGIKLGTLERLIGSQSLFATLERQIALRRQYLLGILMVLLWALSPLGGQSALRLLQVVPRTASSNSTVAYLPIEAATLTNMQGADYISTTWSSYGPLYIMALLTSQKQRNSSQDLFGNVKIPSLSTLEPHLSGENRSWVTVNHSTTIPYSSILGIPIAGIPTTGNASFNLVSRYVSVHCDSVSHEINSTIFQNNSGVVGAGYESWSEGATFIMQSRSVVIPDLISDPIVPFNMTSVNGDNTSDVSFLDCSMAPRDVESSIFCVDQSCHVNAMRNLTVNMTAWWQTDFHGLFFSLRTIPLSTIGVLDRAAGGGTKFTSSLTEHWLQDPETVWATTQQYSGGFTNLSQLSLPTLERNLEVVINTFWRSTYGAEYLFGNLSTNLDLYKNISDTSPDSVLPVINFNTTRAKVARLDGKEYRCNRTFAALLSVVSCILLVAGISSAVLMNMTLAPDILGYVSSHTRDNPFAVVDQPSYLDGLERARAMEDMRVTLGDVNVGSGTGHIAFSMTAEVRRLQKDRLYN